MLIAADDALKSAAEAENTVNRIKRTPEVDRKFEEAINLLSRFEKNFPPKNSILSPNIGGTLGGTVTREVEMSDKPKPPSAILYALKNSLHAKVTCFDQFL